MVPPLKSVSVSWLIKSNTENFFIKCPGGQGYQIQIQTHKNAKKNTKYKYNLVDILVLSKGRRTRLPNTNTNPHKYKYNLVDILVLSKGRRTRLP